MYYGAGMIPVSNGREGTFLLVFLAQYLAGICYLGWQLWSANLRLLDSGEFVAALIVAATANSILLVEGIPMVAERFLKRQRDEGKREGRNSQQKKWEEWNRRRLQAEQMQQPFTEEPPNLEKSND